MSTLDTLTTEFDGTEVMYPFRDNDPENPMPKKKVNGEKIPLLDEEWEKIGFRVKVPNKALFNEARTIYSRAVKKNGDIDTRKLSDFMFDKVVECWVEDDEDQGLTDQDKEKFQAFFDKHHWMITKLVGDYVEMYLSVEKKEDDKKNDS